MRVWPAALCCLVGAGSIGCQSSSGGAAGLTITPGGAGTVQVTGPVVFAAAGPGAEAASWTLAGPGSLSGQVGARVTYRPPAAPGLGQSATLSASHGGATAQVRLELVPAPLPPVSIAGLTAPVTVLYDEWEVPHVHCEVDLDCFAVQGYLQARDRLFQMDVLRRVARGRLAELVGPLGLPQDVQLRTIFTTRDGRRLEEALAEALDRDTATRARVAAYLAGINARLAQLTGPDLPGEYAQLPFPVGRADIPPWSAQDVMALMRLLQFQLSESLGAETASARFALAFGPGAAHQDLGKLATWIRAAQPVQARTHTLLDPRGSAPAAGLTSFSAAAAAAAPWASGLAAAGDRLTALRRALRAQVGQVGSNDWVVDAAHSTSGHAMVANDPHLALPYPPNFHLAALTSARAGDNLDLAGGAFPGTPGALVGRGKNVGWGVTVVGYDVTDLYREQVLPPASCPQADALHPFCVLFKGAPVAVLAAPQAYLVRTGGGLVDAVAAQALTQQEATVFVVPHHGPLVQAPDAGGHALSARWTGQEGWTDDVAAFLGLDTASSVAGAVEALKAYSTGAQNFVLADDQGHIGYDPHALVPIRDFASAALPPWLPLPGDGSAEWGNGDPACGSAAAPRTCFLPDAALPQGQDPAWGFYATANADPLGVSDDNDPLSHPPYLSFDWDDSTGFRHARIVERLAALTAGGGKVSQADMEAIQADHTSTLGRAFTGILASAAFDGAAAASPDFKAARDLLVAWGAAANPAPYDCPTGLIGHDPVLSPPDPDATASANSAACLLFHAFTRRLLQRVFADDLAVAGVALGPTQAIKGMLHMLEPGTPEAHRTFCNEVDEAGQLLAARTCGEQVVEALVTAAGLLAASEGPVAEWRWGRTHTFTATSQFPAVTTGYTAGPFARPGGALTVDVGNPDLASAGPGFPFESSANVRLVAVMDPAAPVTRLQLPGPERDGPYGVLAGPDLLGRWVSNSYLDYASWAQIQSSAAATQTFQPRATP
jgi:penicillin amidase